MHEPEVDKFTGQDGVQAENRFIYRNSLGRQKYFLQLNSFNFLHVLLSVRSMNTLYNGEGIRM